ncbi:hypothetical protein RDABS01_018857 [Bienertia sinuspersici]
MASFFSIFSLILILILSTTTTSAIKTTIKYQFYHSPPPPPPQQHQLNSIIDAIIGAGDFNNWANLLGKADPSIIPLTVTFFIPDDDAFTPTNNTDSSFPSLDPRLFTYHIIPRRFSFSDLRQFPTGARLPTLLPENTLLITNNSATNFTINGASITHPDLFQNAVVSVHGIGSVLDYTLFGKDYYTNNNISSSSPETESSPSSSSTTTMALNPSSSSNENSKNLRNRGSRSHFNFLLVLSMVIFALYVLQCVGFDCLIQNKAISNESDCRIAAANSSAFIRFSSCNRHTMAAVESGLGLYLIMVLICSSYAYLRGFHGPFSDDH